MIINQQGTDQNSGVISQLVPIFPNADMNPQAFGNANVGVGAGASTLPASNTMAPANPLSGMPLSEQASQVSNILGIPPIAFYVLVFGAIAYLLLWRVHWHAMVSD